LEFKIVRLSAYTEFPFGRHTAKVEAAQVEGSAVECGIYLEIVDYGFPGGFTRVGGVANGYGAAAYTFDVEPPPTAPEGPAYLTFRVGVGLFDPYDYTVKFKTRLLIDDVEIFNYIHDMRTVCEVTVTFRKGVTPPVAPTPPAEATPAMLTWLLICLGAAAVGGLIYLYATLKKT